MNRDQIIRAWKDEEYRSSLSELELSALPTNPAGMAELSDAELVAAGNEEAMSPWTLLLMSFMYSCGTQYCANTTCKGTCAAVGSSFGCCHVDEEPL